MSSKWTESTMQNALTERGNLFDYTVYAVVPNVSYAVLIYGEADLLCLTKSGTFHEVEIKVSRSDLVADAKKCHGHEHQLVQYTWFAVPSELERDALEIVPSRFGVVVVEPRQERHWGNRTRVARPAKRFRSPNWRKPSDAEIIRFLRTGVIRMWTRRTGDSA